MGMLRKSLLGVQPQETFEPLVIPPTDQLQSMGQGGHCSFIRRGVKPVYLCGLVDQAILDSRRSDFSNCRVCRCSWVLGAAIWAKLLRMTFARRRCTVVLFYDGMFGVYFIVSGRALYWYDLM